MNPAFLGGTDHIGSLLALLFGVVVVWLLVMIMTDDEDRKK